MRVNLVDICEILGRHVSENRLVNPDHIVDVLFFQRNLNNTYSYEYGPDMGIQIGVIVRLSIGKDFEISIPTTRQNYDDDVQMIKNKLTKI